MPTLSHQIINLITKNPGLSDREITNTLRGSSAPQQPINTTARNLAVKGKLTRQKRPDGKIGNYPAGTEAPVKQDTLTPQPTEHNNLPLPNSENPKKGRDFERLACIALEDKYKIKFAEKAILIGKPPKAHNFDLVSEDGRIIAECKNYSWTKTGNVPSAKMGFINEAVFYLTHTPKNVKKIVILRKDNHPKRTESLAEYYARTYYHLLDRVIIMELDINNMLLKKLEIKG